MTILLTYTPNPVQVIGQAIRLCKHSEKDDYTLIKKCIDLNHTSVLEHVSFTFLVKCSRVAQQQITRHRIASYTCESLRYIKLDDIEIYYPDMQELANEIHSIYVEMCNVMKAEKARYILPLGTMTQMMITMNLRSLRNFFQLRCCKHSQEEIRHIAKQMYQEVRKIDKILVYKTFANCVNYHNCKECEKFVEV